MKMSMTNDVGQTEPDPAAKQEQDQNIQDIQSIQKTEKELLDSLETNAQLTEQQRDELIDKINALSKMRMDLYKSLGAAQSLYGKTLDQSQATLVQQTGVIDMEERALNDYKLRLRALKEKNAQQLHLVEINRYYSEKYGEHATIAWGLVQLFIGLIIINFLYKMGVLFDGIYYALIILLTGYLAYRFWGTLLVAYRRNNMNYDQLDFAPPNPASIPAGTNYSSSGGDPWYMPSMTCIGSACCTSGMVFDASANICSAASSVSDPSTPTSSEGFAPVGVLNKGFGRIWSSS